MSTIISDAIEELLEEGRYSSGAAEADARRILERNKRQRRLDEIRFSRLPYDDAA